MTISLKNKLSYTWAKLQRQDRLYSHLFNSEYTSQIYSYDLFAGRNVKNGIATHTVSEWMKAMPIKGESDQYLLFKGKYDKADRFIQNRRDRSEEQLSGVYTRDQALEQIKKFEEAQLAAKHLVSRKQSFKGYIKTKLAV